MHPPLLRSQKNSVFEFIESTGLNPSEFKWGLERKGYSKNPCPVIMHHSDGYYFLFCTPESNQNSWQYKCSPGTGCFADQGLLREGWGSILHRFSKWCEDLKIEIEAPDLWGSVRQIDIESIRVAPDTNDPFTYSEVIKVQENIRQIIEYVQKEAAGNQSLASKQDSIIASLNRLEDHAKGGIGRIDWTNQLVGIVINIIIASSFAPERAGEFLTFIKELFHSGINLLING